MYDNREVDHVLMSVRNNLGGVIMVSSITAQMSFRLLVYLLRLAKKGLLAAKSADNFKTFTKLSEGNFTVYNIPLSQEKAIRVRWINKLELQLQEEKNPIQREKIKKSIKGLEKEIPELEQLRKLNIEHCVLPKLNGSDQTIQVAVAKKNDQTFKNWFINHLISSLGGGEKTLEDLKVFTEGNYTIFNFPFEGEELNAVLLDFDTIGINYAVLPDLKVGDGNSQVAVPNADRSKLEVWIRMWKEKQIREGKNLKEIYAMNQESYVNTAAAETDDYIRGSDTQYQEVQKEFEENSKETPWTASLKRVNSEDYVKLDQDANYEKISINRETLHTNMNISDKVAEMDAKGYFISRIPGTYDVKQKTLIIPKTRVFTTDTDQTFLAFLPKNEPSLVADVHGNISEWSFQDVYKSYDAVNRGFSEIKKIKKNVPLQKEADLGKKTGNISQAAPKL